MIGTMMLASLVNFVNIGLRALQTNNVVDVNYKGAYVTSWIMTIVSVVNVHIVVDHGLMMILPIGFGGSLGIVCSMYLHVKYKNRI